jgi:hypothetical protein
VILKVEIQISDFSVQIGLLGVGQGDKNDSLVKFYPIFGKEHVPDSKTDEMGTL